MPNPASDYPAAVHSPTDISAFSATALGSTGPVHTAVHGKLEQEVVSTQTKLGTGASTPTSGMYMRGSSSTASAWAYISAGDLPVLDNMNGTLAITKGGTGATSASAARTALSLVPGTDVQVYDADLATIAGLTATTDNFLVSVSSAWASRTPSQVRTTLALVPGTDVQAYDADLLALAGVSTTGLLVRTGAGTATTLGPQQGFLINGKIVPSVATDDLTVAVKTLAGADPSAASPVYCRIGDTVRSITAALSVTKNDATNWFNAGSAELATKEIDYFVYLGYNATDGVVIGFARIPHAQTYADFSTTTTNEKYAAISTITTAASTDQYENIGRFAATLSAGAGYTWTVPTFTGTNLINRPTLSTRWLSWQPVYAASGSQTYTSVTTTTAEYKITAHECKCALRAEGTTGGTPSTAVTASTPITPKIAGANAIFDACGLTDASNVAGICIVDGTAANLSFRRYDAANWGAGATRRISYGGSYGIN